jgi:hypothetical protein
LQRTRTSVPKPVLAAAIMRTWNAWRKGQKTSSIKLMYNGKPVTIPEKLV